MQLSAELLMAILGGISTIVLTISKFNTKRKLEASNALETDELLGAIRTHLGKSDVIILAEVCKNYHKIIAFDSAVSGMQNQIGKTHSIVVMLAQAQGIKLKPHDIQVNFES